MYYVYFFILLSYFYDIFTLKIVKCFTLQKYEK